ncbi:bifunctional riboflavin kinase/FAD synthetase [Miltoncostaea marina]|uniref:bifunctional riboflavin kinase/FAD synthetase n=1 Tax=Miltoncostaea marina TaxID=2843215 RepID=UPI001C3DB687|nr:bifunctional riboflavin kinase/FAD synthetase [Miltoncostaea marina]
MRRYNSLGDLPLGGPRRVLAIGTFDGVHVGHQAVIGRAMELAAQRGLPCMAMTFEPQPIAVLRPELRPGVLTHIGFKSQLIERLGVDELLVVPFTRAFARIRAERFAEMLVSPPVGADAVVVGENFRFGHGGAGTVEMLAQFGRSRALHVEWPPMVHSDDGKPVSSTRIRRLVATGQVAKVIPLLGRMHSVEGVVVHGEGRGRGMGIPTANLDIPADSALPSRGVYACRAVLAGGRSAAAVNIGVAPTFTAADARSTLRLEAFLLDHDGGDIYGQSMRIDFIERLRDERRFDSPDALLAQVREDVARVRELAGGVTAPEG